MRNWKWNKLCTKFIYLRQRRRDMFLPVFVCLSVCEQDYWKRYAWISMKCCLDVQMSGVWTWTNWLTFEPDFDYSPDAGTGLLSPMSSALQCGILLRRENPTYRYWDAATHGFKMVLRPTAAATLGCTILLLTASHRNNFLGGTCTLPSALVVPLSISHAYYATAT